MQTLPVGPAKSREIKSLLLNLEEPFPADHTPQLERLKILGREPKDADELFTAKASFEATITSTSADLDDPQGIRLLLQYGLDTEHEEAASRQALSCLANSMLLRPPTRQLAVGLGAAPKIAAKYGNAVDSTDEFLDARILLLLSYQTSCDLRNLLTTHKLDQSITRHIQRHAEQPASLEKDVTAVPSRAMALSETLKLLFALTKYCPEDAHFDAAITPMIRVLTSLQRRKDATIQQLLQHIVDALHVLPLEEANINDMFPQENENRLLQSLVALMDDVTANSKPAELDLKLSSTMIILLQLHKPASTQSRAFLRDQLLPREEERDKPLGQSNTLSARLLRLSTSGYTPQLRELVPELLFELSDRNAETFVNNVGYGYASGYLQNRKIPFTVPDGKHVASDGSSSSMRADVNPVTGQFYAAEPAVEAPQMTDEEKEREAERLFVLFERLKQTGVVNVKNPVEDAIHSGRFEELPDD